jgi:DNA-binding response OmpR family regulator
MPSAKSKFKILLAEDDTTLGVMYRVKLENDGYEVTLVENGSDALKQATENKFDLVMLDIIMPQLDGFSVLKALKENVQTKKIPVIMLTNLGTEEDKVKGVKLGAADYLIKSSLTPEQVSETINKLLS